jgi:HD domain-containing protein
VTARRSALRVGALANLVGYGWSGIAAALVLDAGGVSDPTSPAALAALIGAGFTLYVVGWALNPAIHAPLWLGQPFSALVHALFDMLPAGTVMIALAAATVVLTGPLGLLALALFALIVVVPQSFLTYAARTRPVALLEPDVATRRYAHAIAVQLDLPRDERRHLSRVVAAACKLPPTGDPIGYVCATLQDPSLANDDAQLATEWWNGGGGPIGLVAEGIPLSARVLAVAQTWSFLTASGSPQLGHHDAMSYLMATAGTRLDPVVVQAAQAVISQERVTAAEPAPQPRLHQLRLPAPLRRALTAG